MNDDRIETMVAALRTGDRRALAKAITLVESHREEDLEISQALIKSILPYSGKSFRIGISGVPGVGKSTFIESYGLKLVESGEKTAVLAVDPSSSISGGSILGDKTRMEKLSQSELSFIRPSPSRGSLGGVARKTRETILLCEAAGFTTIIVETVGVGQSEIDVASMTDVYMLLMLPNAGDELQGIKKGILELADCLVINKMDADLQAARRTQADLKSALRYLHPRTAGWSIPVLLCSAFLNQGLDEILETLGNFKDMVQSRGIFQSRRNNQNLDWMDSLSREELQRSFYDNPEIQAASERLKAQILEGGTTPVLAALELMKLYRRENRQTGR